MNKYVLFLRGINVGGKNVLPMKALSAALAEIGLSEIKTYIQSGNVVFSSAESDKAVLQKRTADVISGHFSIEPALLLLSRDEFLSSIKGNPYDSTESDPKSIHVGYLDREPENPDFAKMNSLKKDSEEYSLSGKFFYLHAPEGIGRSKLAAASEKLLGVSMTDRNWNTVCKIRDLLG